MNCQKNVVVTVLAGIVAGTLLGAGTSQVAQVIARRQAISTEDVEYFAAPRDDRVYRNTRSIREFAEGNRETDTLPRQRSSALQGIQDLQNRVAEPSSFVNVNVPRECHGIIGRPLDRCIKRMNESGFE